MGRKGRLWRAGIFLAMIAGACGDRRKLSLFAPAQAVRDGGSDGDGNDEPDHYRRCDTPSDCTEERPFCEDERCVECLASGDCDRPGQSCRFEDHSCVATCHDNSDCSGGGNAIICAVGAGVCVECARQIDCAGEAGEPFCERRTGQCVECLEDGNCGDRLCHPGSHECVDCIEDWDCDDSEECVRGECQR
jgi:hypothetical protein